MPVAMETDEAVVSYTEDGIPGIISLHFFNVSVTFCVFLRCKILMYTPFTWVFCLVWKIWILLSKMTTKHSFLNEIAPQR